MTWAMAIWLLVSLYVASGIGYVVRIVLKEGVGSEVCAAFKVVLAAICIVIIWPLFIVHRIIKEDS